MAFKNTHERDVVDPIVEDNGIHGTKATHPAFGQIGASRIHGYAVLYDSDFAHNGFIRITIRRSQLHRDLSRDWHFGEKELISVDLSEAQWASFVSSMNIGTGTPCTIDRVGGEPMPRFPLPSTTETFKAEVDKKLAASILELDEAIAELPPKGKAAQKLRRIRMELAQNLPFVAEQFGKHVERSVEKAKAEIHGYMNNALRSAGLEHLGGNAPLQITDEDE